jgi:sugar lactone lactonase YvrE
VTEDLVAWVDIARNRLYLGEGEVCRSIELAVKATVVLSRTDQELLVASANGLGLVSLSSGEYRETVSFTDTIDPAIYRTNDGCILSDGRCLIGTMHRSAPEVNPGAVFVIDGNGVMTLAFDDVFIPNSFVELRNGDVLISDSHTGIIYRCTIDTSGENCRREPWYQTRPGIAPDGGCMLSGTYIALAMWDGACIMLFEESGIPIAEIAVPARRPTNVKYLAQEALMWVTSASEGLTESELDEYPLSGKTFCVSNRLSALCN